MTATTAMPTFGEREAAPLPRVTLTQGGDIIIDGHVEGMYRRSGRGWAYLHQDDPSWRYVETQREMRAYVAYFHRWGVQRREHPIIKGHCVPTAIASVGLVSWDQCALDTECAGGTHSRAWIPLVEGFGWRRGTWYLPAGELAKRCKTAVLSLEHEGHMACIVDHEVRFAGPRSLVDYYWAPPTSLKEG